MNFFYLHTSLKTFNNNFIFIINQTQIEALIFDCVKSINFLVHSVGIICHSIWSLFNSSLIFFIVRCHIFLSKYSQRCSMWFSSGDCVDNGKTCTVSCPIQSFIYLQACLESLSYWYNHLSGIFSFPRGTMLSFNMFP